MFYLLQIFHFFDSFLVVLEHFQLKHVSSFILDQYLVAFFIFQFHSYLQFTNNQRSVIVCLKTPAIVVCYFFIFFVFDKDLKKSPFLLSINILVCDIAKKTLEILSPSGTLR